VVVSGGARGTGAGRPGARGGAQSEVFISSYS
jgi:hypothetical protein